jgi:hypothetical protein
MKVAGRILLVLVIALTSLSAMSPERADRSVRKRSRSVQGNSGRAGDL